MNKRFSLFVFLCAMAAVAIGGRCGAEEATTWPTLQQNNQRTGYISQPILPPYEEVWRHDFEEMIDCRVQPIIADGKVLVSTYQGNLHALDALGGEKEWVFNAEGPIFHSPAVSGGRVYLASQDSFVYCLDISDGSLIWKFKTGEGIWAAPMVEGEKVYIGSRDGVFYCLGAEEGELLWEFETSQPIVMTAAIKGDKVFFGSENMILYALDRHKGEVLWKQQTMGQSMRSYWPVVSGNYVYCCTLPVRSYWQHEFNVKLDRDNPDRLERVRDWLEKDPWSQTFFAFDAETGEETVFPVLWTAGGGTVAFPPVALDGNRIAMPAPAGERTRSSGTTSLSLIDEKTLKVEPDYIRVIADESYGFSAAGKYVFQSHHDYLRYVDISKPPDRPANTRVILGYRDRPVDARSAQWYPNHDNHPGWHSASLAYNRVYWINQGSWLFVFKGSTQ